MLSWEYPPRIIGGIARHVEEIAWALAKRPDYEVHVVTCDAPGAPAEEVIEGCRSALPSYMVPTRIYELDKWHLNPNGKTDYKSMAEFLKQAGSQP